jgi:hypothetical protein
MSVEPARAARQYTIRMLAQYWRGNPQAIEALELPQADIFGGAATPPVVRRVALPDWAADCGVDGAILVPAHAVCAGEQPQWARTDWLAAAFWYLNGTAERAHEARHGPIHSYAFRLEGWPAEIWERAWANRIALLLRRQAARARSTDEVALFGPLPKAEIVLTHDVDAIEKTMAIRLKQGAFNVFNALRCLVRADLAGAAGKFAAALRFAVGPGSYWNFGYFRDLESAHGWLSHFNVYGGGGGWNRSPRKILLDPAYDVRQASLADELRGLHGRGFTIGLHQSFDAWRESPPMRIEKERLELALGAPATSCRQHWLRFSWSATWKAQQEAGFTLDSTLGFNDRPGFRAGAALRYTPYDAQASRAMAIDVLPMVLMDSHVYDYALQDAAGRRSEILRWIREIRDVSGTAAFNWHVHTVSDDYGWRDGYEMLVEALRAT